METGSVGGWISEDTTLYLPLFGISPIDSETSVAMVSGCLEKRSDVCGRVTVFVLAESLGSARAIIRTQ